MSTRRYTDPVYLQFIWDALEAPTAGRPYTFECIFDFIRTEKDPKCNPTKLQHELTNAVWDRCISVNGGQYKKADWSDLPAKGKHDWYCFQCHGPGPVVCCPTCFRVFHHDCLPAALESSCNPQLPDEDPTPTGKSVSSQPPSAPCPVCNRSTRVSLNPQTTVSDLRNIFLTALERMRSKNPWRTLYTIGYVNETHRNDYLSYKQVNTRVISDRLHSTPKSSEGYLNRTAFLLDLDILVHNTAVIYGPKADMTNTARQIRSQLQKEMRESSLCVDCYLRSKGGKPDAKQIVEACRNPHRLLWFHHSSWSFRPCKVLHESNDGYEVICFDGRREREFIPSHSAVDMNFTASELGLRMTASLKKALEEAERYKKNQMLRSSGKERERACPSPRLSEMSSTVSPSMSPTPSSELTASDHNREKSSKSFKHSTNQQGSHSTSSLVTSSAGKSSVKRRRGTALKVTSPIEPSVSSTSCGYSAAECNFRTKARTSQPPSVSDSDRASPKAFSLSVHGSGSRTHETSRSPCRRAGNAMVPRLRSLSNSSSASDESTNSSSSAISSISSVDTLRRSSFQYNSRLSSASQATLISKSKQSQFNHSNAVFPNLSSKPTTKTCESTKEPPTPKTKRRRPRTLGQKPYEKISGTLKAGNGACVSLSSAASCSSSLSSDFSNVSSGSTTAPATSSPKTYPDTQLSISHGKSVDRSLRGEGVVGKAENSRRYSPKPSVRGTNRSQLFGRTAVDDSDAKSISSSASSGASSPSKSSIYESSSPLGETDQRLSNRLSKVCDSSLGSDSEEDIASSHLDSTSSSGKLHVGSKSAQIKPKLAESPVPGRFRSSWLASPSKAEAASDCQRVLSRKSRDAPGSNPAFRGSTASSYTDTNGDYSPHKSTEKSSPDTNSRRGTLKRSSADPGFTTKVASGKRTKSGSATAVKNSDGNGSIATAAAAAVGNSAVIASDSGHSSSSPALASASSNQQASMLQTSAQIFSSAASSASSVSPATLSSSSGIGSSLSDQKSVDASPGDLGVSLHSTLSSLPIDPAIVKAIEERVRQKLNERIEALILERDRAREKLSQMESYVAKLEHDHKVELCECKKRSWCVICLKEALYHCCAGVAYCSKECQLKHWTSQHSRECRRLAEAQRSTTAPAN
ncbi:hypothetical protein AAHC03_014055 [Spirometra sp. Aus1]